MDILEQLKSQNITIIPYKGPILAISAYENLSLRQFLNIELFVDPNDVKEIIKILMSRGYRLYIEDYDENFYIKNLSQHIFFNENTGISIIVHWKLEGFIL